MSSPATDPSITSWSRSPKRLHQIDPGLALADMFDPVITRKLWDSLPEECRRDHFDKKTMPTHYRPAIREVNAGGPWTACYLNFRDLPEPMTWEIAWIIHRYIELGQFVHVVETNAVFSLLRAAVHHGDDESRSAQSLLHRSPDQWVRAARKAQLRGEKIGEYAFTSGTHRLGHMSAVLGYAYHRGPWWELNVWNPGLDPRVPQREHEPQGGTTMHFTNLTSIWLREGAKYWLSAGLSAERYTWSTLKSRLDALKWLQRYIDTTADEGPCLTADPHRLRGFIRGFCDTLLAHRIQSGPRAGKPLAKNPRRQIMTAIEQFYQFMYDHRDEAATELGIDDWATLRPEYCVLFRPEDKPRLTNVKATDMVLDDDVMQQIAEGSALLAQSKEEGGLGDLQAFHIMMLLLRTGRRANEVLMMDFDPLEPILRTSEKDSDGSGFVARMRYQQTKIESDTTPTIPVDEEIVTIIRTQQRHAREMMAEFGNPGLTPKYLFLRATRNRLGDKPYPMPTMHLRFGKLTSILDIVDSTGRQVQVSKTHRFRHTAATNLINAGVPLHVVMRYFGHMSPDMTLHYAVTSAQTMEEEFLRYKKVTRDGRTAAIDSSDLYDLIQLDKRADRILPNGWCMLPPKQLCDKGNACLSCSKFVTDSTHAPQLRSQLTETRTLIERRQTVFTAKYGAPMDETNIWLHGRQSEVDSLRRILLSLDDVSAANKAVRGSGTIT